MSPKIFLLFSSLVALTSCADQNINSLRSQPADESSNLWCSASVAVSDGGLPDWKEIEKDAVHVVRADLQRKAIRSLSRSSLVKLKSRAATKYMRAGESLNHSQSIYLVRAAAPNLSADYTPQLDSQGRILMGFSYSPSRKQLSVSSYSLGNPDPVNLAIVVEVPDLIERVRGSCLSAM
jgi:hypothetical protein